MKQLTKLSLLATILVTAGCSNIKTTPEEKAVSALPEQSPNILFIMTDDQGPWALGRSGNQQALTPNLDEFASQGMFLPNAYTTTPVCSPSRAGLLTSQYGYEVGVDDWINTKAKSLTGHQPEVGIEPEYETWPEILQQAGYVTGLVGKWHIGYQERHHPKNHGYQEFVGFVGGGTTPQNPYLDVNGEHKQEEGLTVDILTGHAIDFIRKHKDEKFALSLHYRAPHYAFLPVAPEDEAPFLNMDIKLPHPDYPDLNKKRATKLMREYLSAVRGVDRNVGKLLAELNQLGLADNTIVVFTSDNGYNMAHNGIWHKGNGFWLLNKKHKGTKNVPAGQRPNMYDNSLKVPTMIRWPGVIKPNTVNASTLSNLDWFPTLVELAKGKVSETNIVRGQSYVPVFLNNEKVLSTDYYAAYSTLHQSVTHMRMYSDGSYKLVKDFKNPGRDELYDLINDPEETQNIIHRKDAKTMAIIAKLEQIIQSKMRDLNDPLVAANPQ